MNYAYLEDHCNLNFCLDNELPSNDYMERTKDLGIMADVPEIISYEIVPNSVQEELSGNLTLKHVQSSENENSTTQIVKHTRDALTHMDEF